MHANIRIYSESFSYDTHFFNEAVNFLTYEQKINDVALCKWKLKALDENAWNLKINILVLQFQHILTLDFDSTEFNGLSVALVQAQQHALLRSLKSFVKGRQVKGQRKNVTTTNETMQRDKNALKKDASDSTQH